MKFTFPAHILSALAVVFLVSFFVLHVFAHPGGTDEDGGHIDHETGEYHYHHGYPAHDHYDMDGDGTVDCPYAFKDNTRDSYESNHQSASTGRTQPTLPPADQSQHSISPDDSPRSNSSPSLESLWYQLDSDQKLIVIFFAVGIPSGILSVCLFLILSKYDDRISKPLRILLNILTICLGISALPAAIYIFSASYVAVSVLVLLSFVVGRLVHHFRKPAPPITTKIVVPKDPAAESSVSEQAKSAGGKPQEAVYLMEAVNGMLVNVPESKLEAWLAAQEELRTSPQSRELTETEKRIKDRIIRNIYGPQEE